MLANTGKKALGSRLMVLDLTWEGDRLCVLPPFSCRHYAVPSWIAWVN